MYKTNNKYVIIIIIIKWNKKNKIKIFNNNKKFNVVIHFKQLKNKYINKVTEVTEVNNNHYPKLE